MGQADPLTRLVLGCGEQDREVKGKAESTKARALCGFPLASLEVPVHPAQVTSSAPVKQGPLRTFSSKKADVLWALLGHPAPPGEESWSLLLKFKSHKSCLEHLIKRPGGNTEQPGPLSTLTHVHPGAHTNTTASQAHDHASAGVWVLGKTCLSPLETPELRYREEGRQAEHRSHQRLGGLCRSCFCLHTPHG